MVALSLFESFQTLNTFPTQFNFLEKLSDFIRKFFKKRFCM